MPIRDRVENSFHLNAGQSTAIKLNYQQNSGNFSEAKVQMPFAQQLTWSPNALIFAADVGIDPFEPLPMELMPHYAVAVYHRPVDLAVLAAPVPAL